MTELAQHTLVGLAVLGIASVCLLIIGFVLSRATGAAVFLTLAVCVVYLVQSLTT